MSYKHGHDKTGHESGTHISWRAMKQRCLNPRYGGYGLYGGRGIKVCQRWLTFTSFLEDMGVRPKGKTLDRINPNKGYFKSNCRWASPKVQANNKRDYKGAA